MTLAEIFLFFSSDKSVNTPPYLSDAQKFCMRKTSPERGLCPSFRMALQMLHAFFKGGLHSRKGDNRGWGKREGKREG
jgi:hypothetical protein